MISFTSAELHTWLSAFLWPMARIMSLVATAPVFGNSSVPTSTKVAFSVALTLVIAPAVPAMPAMDPMSLAGLLILVQQILIGAAMGLSMRLIFAAVEMAGEVSGLTMGLGFATFYDPQSRGHSSAISRFFALIASMAFIAFDGHLMLISTLVNSFTTLPIAETPYGTARMFTLASWGGKIFNAAVQLSLPIVGALLITNIALGVLTRAAPQLNLYGIGFPITIGVGFLVISLTLPYWSTPLTRLFADGLGTAQLITKP